MAHDVFISYATEDILVVEAICHMLEQRGIRCWYAKRNEIPGEDFYECFMHALTGSKAVVFVLSKYSNKSKFVQGEISQAFDKKIIVIPFRIDEVELTNKISFIIKDIHWIDAISEPRKKEIEELADKVSEILHIKPAEPKVNEPVAGKPVASEPIAVAPTVAKPSAVPPEEQKTEKARLTWNLPYLQNKNFIGRKDVLKTISDEFSPSNPGGASTIIISGLGGNGKTQLVTEYAYENKDRYRLIWWIKTESMVSLENDYLSLSGYFNLPDKNTVEKQTLIKMIRDQLEKNRDWLLIFDNADTQDIVRAIPRDYVPRLNTGHILITSRSPDWKKLGKVIRLGVFSREESIDFITNYLADEKKCDRELAGKLADNLDQLPLALSHACAYIDQRQITVTEYIQRFDKYKQKLLNMPLENEERTINATWKISFDMIKENCPAGAHLLNLCAFFAHDDIPLDLLSAGPQYLPKAAQDIFTDDLLMDEAKSSLNRYSFINIDNNTISIHKLVQMIIRTNLPEEEQVAWINMLISTINSLLPKKYEKKENRVKIIRLLPHAMNLMELAEEKHIKNDKINGLMESIAKNQYKMSDYHGAIEYFTRTQKLYAETGNKLGEANCYNGLGMSYRMLDNYPRAIENLQKALDIAAHNGCKPEDFKNFKRAESTSYYELGRAYHMIGDIKKTIECLEKALSISVEIQNRVGESNDYNDLGRAYHMLGDYRKAIEYQEKAMKISQEIGNWWGESKCCWDSGRAYHMLGDYRKAIEYQDKLMKISLEIGNKWGESKSSWDSGRAYYMLGDYQKAIEYLEKALKIAVDICNKWGEGNHYNDLGKVYRTIGDNKKALEYQEKALKIAVDIGNKAGEADCYDEFGAIYHALGDYRKAIEYLHKALKIVVDMGYKEVESNCYCTLGAVYHTLGDGRMAVEYLEKALKIAVDIGYKAKESNCYDRLGAVYHTLGDDSKSVEYMEKALKIAVDIGYKPGELCCYKNFINYYTSLGDNKYVLYYQDKVQKLNAGI